MAPALDLIGSTQRLTLRPYQDQTLAASEAAEARGCRRQLWVLATGLGKAQPVDEPVLTPSGWRPIGELEVGDAVISSDGCPTEVTGVFPQGTRPAVRVTFDDGSWTRCDRSHLWTVATDTDITKGRPWRTFTTAQLIERGLDGSGRKAWRVPVVAPVYAEPLDLPVPPYTLGVLLGDGCLRRDQAVMFTSDDPQVAHEVNVELAGTARLERVSGDGTRTTEYRISRIPQGRGSGFGRANPITAGLRFLGLMGKGSAEKFIPEAYLRGSIDQRVALLQGLMDTDGTQGGCTSFSTVSPFLAAGVAELVRSLGGVVRTSTRIPNYTHRGEMRQGRLAYNLILRLPVDIRPFRLRRKLTVWAERPRLAPTRKIVAIGPPDELVEQVCISVGAPDQLYVTRDHIVTHNTVCFVAHAAKRGDRTLIIAHRDELIGQAAAKARQWWPDADIGIVKGPRNDVGAQDIVVASVQSLSPARMARLGAFGLVIVDEAHHATSASYTRVLETLRAGEADGPLLVGVTATPERTDGKGLSQHFSEIVANYPILWGIQNGYLVDVRCKDVKLTNLRLEDVKTSHGDYAEGALGEAMADAQAPWHIVKEWKELAAGRLTASFHPTIAAAEAQAAEFMAQGVRSACVSGVSLDDRRRILSDLTTGRLQVVTNAMVLTEGWDFPALSCVIMGRPTKSSSLYTQVIGRGLRPYPGKEDCLVLDVCGASEKVNLCSVPSLFGVPKAKMRNRTVTEALEKVAEEEAKPKRAPGPRTTGDVVTRDVDLFKSHGVKPGRVAWAKTRSGAFATSAGKMSVLMEPMVGEVYRVVTVSEKGERSVLAEGLPLSLAQGLADDHVRRNAPAALVDRMAPWRKKKPSEKQLAFAQRLGIGVPDSFTADDVSRAIDARMAEIRLSKARRGR
jgi:superfamily II DNA or RNA helicase